MENAKDIFTALGHQIAQKAQNNEVIIAGDFNAKLQINSNSCKQHISRNGKLLREIMDNNDLTPANLKSNHGIWTRVNRKNAEQKSVIDYILTTEQIARNTQSVIVDEEGNLRIKGKNETDHNTIIMSIRINDPRKPTFREKWNLKNKEGWTIFNKEIMEAYNNNNIKINNYQEAEKEIKKILKKTIGTKKVRSDKTRRTTNQDIKEARKIMKNHKKEFQKACKTGTTEDKITTKKTYMASQVKLRSEINKAESTLIEERLKKLHEKAIINPNTIWEARKKAKGCRELDYNTYSEEGTLIEDPEKTKDHIANYFEQLYQAREGTAPYAEWTNKIKTQVRKNLEKDPDTTTETEDQITEKEMNAAIKKLKRNKSLGPDKIPNEIFIEANKETRKVLKEILEKVHKEEEIPRSWEEGEIIRLYKGKGLKGKCSNERGITLASNVGKLYERIINERVKKTSHNNKSTSWRQTWMLHCGPPNSPKTNHIRDKSQRTNSLHNIPRCAKSIRQSMVRCNNLCPTPEWSKREEPKNDKKTQLQPHSQDTNQAWANKENTNQGQYQTGRSTVSNRIRNTDRWNS